MYYHCGVPVQAVSEYKISQYLNLAKLIIIPSPVMFASKSWEALLEQLGRGATVVISGAFDLDELPFSSLSTRSLKNLPVAESEIITISGREYVVRYEGEKMQRLEKAVDQSTSQPVQPLIISFNSGRLFWSPLPLELSDSMTALETFYNLALSDARISPIFSAIPRSPAVLILPSLFRDVVLYTFVSETDRDTRMEVTHLESRTRFSVNVRAQRTAMVLLERKTGKIIGRM